ncbi:uncharacterized protein LOC120249621 [Dioscorea cayenensis subsp. rotundata]|uniref:Uncharacterized protein LOC120249621 n=1 Tax=Dioscorea cayennensis subsp. rotundata TaxID=55577 RepID=A0AB40AGZ2_DIOCR|nr:uncharacterized protein LOC120249621 [Dioscorea cayenensis subsp. rotundata]XP_039114131.1 uncharacterized protein LOC120249621 [Dioscorea cayenensis subsp. rotundata]
MENGAKDDKKLADTSASENFPSSTQETEGNAGLEVLNEMETLTVHKDNENLQLEEEGKEKKLVDALSSENSPRSIHDPEVKNGETPPSDMDSLNVKDDNTKLHNEQGEGLDSQVLSEVRALGSEKVRDKEQILDEDLPEEKEADPVFDGTEEVSEMDGRQRSSNEPYGYETEVQAFAWPEKAVALKNFVKEKSTVTTVAVSTFLRRLSGRRDEDGHSIPYEDGKNDDSAVSTEEADSATESKFKEALLKAGELASWNPLNYIKIGRDTEVQNKPGQLEGVTTENKVEEQHMNGRIIIYTRLGCPDCKEVRLFFQQRRLRYVEINLDIYPSRKLELEKNTGSSAVPRVYFNDFLVGGLSELKALEDSGRFDEKINYVISDDPSPEAPSPPLPGEDDMSSSGKIDELVAIVRKMKESIVLKDRFYKMRRFSNCFLGSEAVDFLSEDQYLEREEAVEFGKKLVSEHFFHHVMDENIFEDGNHVYRFLENDPVVSSQCCNIPRGLSDVKPKPIVEIASRLRFLSYAIFEAYVSEDGKHIDYNSIYGSEEFRRYKRIIEELHRVDLDNVSREEKLAFFINLHNMMAIDVVLTWGYPVRALDRRRFLGDFKYVVGGCAYSLSAIQNGILRGNQRPPYNLTKPFGPKDRRSEVALPYTEPLVHFALVCGSRSGPALRCYSPGNIDKELMEAARDFLRTGGLIIDKEAKVASVSKILRWYSVDFGKNEMEMLKHAANYLEPSKTEELLELLVSNQLKVTYQPYDWGLNC